MGLSARKVMQAKCEQVDIRTFCNNQSKREFNAGNYKFIRHYCKDELNSQLT
jgi:hypothetical protein